MAAAMNHLELTRAVGNLQSQLADLAGRLTAAIPQMERGIAHSTEGVKIVVESLRDEFKPVVDKVQPMIETLTNMQVHIASEAERLKGAESLFTEIQADHARSENKFNEALSEIKRIQHNVQSSAQQAGRETKARVQAEVKIDLVSAKLESLVHEHEHLKRVEENHYQQQQMQIATATSASSST